MEYSLIAGVHRCRFLGFADGRHPVAIFEREGRSFQASVLNPGVLHGDLPYGAEIEVRLEGTASSSGGLLARAELLLGPEDRVGPGLADLLRGQCAAPFGMARQAGGAWRYLVLSEEDGRDLLLEGPLEIHGFSARLLPAESALEVRKHWLDRLAESLPRFPLALHAVYFGDSLAAGSELPEIAQRDLGPGRLEALAADLEHDYYWTEGFDPDFFRALARAGFITITIDRGDRPFMAPQLQPSYAVLDWEDLHRSKSLSRLFRSGRLEALGARLSVEADIEPVLGGLDRQWGRETWLKPEYLDLLRSLACDPREGFRLRAIGLRLGPAGAGPGELVAGEIGYTIGRTYTSLSGFLRRERREWNDLGKVQLHLLAALLRDRGYAFWNLGHPQMQYKLDLGARVLPRKDFLERWERAVAEADPGLGEDEGD